MDLEQAAMQLYEDESLTDELDDEAATALLKWGENMLPQIAGVQAQSANLDDAFSALRGYIKRVNYLTGHRSDIEPDRQRALFAQMSDAAAQMGFPLNLERITHSSQQLSEMSAMESVQMMTSWVTPASTQAETQETAVVTVDDAAKDDVKPLVPIGEQIPTTTPNTSGDESPSSETPSDSETQDEISEDDLS